jgi:hypothetical protein
MSLQKFGNVSSREKEDTDAVLIFVLRKDNRIQNAKNECEKGYFSIIIWINDSFLLFLSYKKL